MRMTYTLKVKTIRKIKLLARHADMGVSEVFAKLFLDSVLIGIDIEGVVSYLIALDLEVAFLKIVTPLVNSKNCFKVR